jgi:hypothetical protein
METYQVWREDVASKTIYKPGRQQRCRDNDSFQDSNLPVASYRLHSSQFAR